MQPDERQTALLAEEIRKGSVPLKQVIASLASKNYVAGTRATCYTQLIDTTAVFKFLNPIFYPQMVIPANENRISFSIGIEAVITVIGPLTNNYIGKYTFEAPFTPLVVQLNPIKRQGIPLNGLLTVKNLFTSITNANFKSTPQNGTISIDSIWCFIDQQGVSSSLEDFFGYYIAYEHVLTLQKRNAA